MQLVVVATVLALVGAEHRCGPTQCRPMNMSMEVESCGIRDEVHTTVCVGHCYHEDPVYHSYVGWPEQKVCGGDWHYEVKFIQDCPIAVTYPVARSCACDACNTGYTDCGRFGHDLPSCLLF
uniref:Follicle-stimulating hormone beta subunit n=1 Tax=Bostrychus sinensis TaxID=86224 RepID=A0A346B3P5_9TELE|nr:follicle-stimulating hormone beta subunit [Bostrychus sinensis]